MIAEGDRNQPLPHGGSSADDGGVFAAGLLCLTKFYLPHANKRQDALRNEIKGKPAADLPSPTGMDFRAELRHLLLSVLSIPTKTALPTSLCSNSIRLHSR